MSSLPDLQRAMRAALLGAPDADAPAEVIGGALSAAARMNVYRNNVLGNLTGALRTTYPAVERLVGADFFAGACAAFIRAMPPISADLYEYGDGFADFLAGFDPAQGVPYLPDVARLEWAVNVALHAPRTPALTAADLAAVPEADVADLRFIPHPTLTLLTTMHPARAIWEAVLQADGTARGAALAAIDPDAPGERLAVLLQDGELAALSLSPSAFDLARALTGGETLADALALVPEADAAALFGGFLAHGFFARSEEPAGLPTPQPG